MGFWSILAICLTVMAVAYEVRIMFACWCEARVQASSGVRDRLTGLEEWKEGDRVWSRIVGCQLRDLQKRVYELERKPRNAVTCGCKRVGNHTGEEVERNVCDACDLPLRPV